MDKYLVYRRCRSDKLSEISLPEGYQYSLWRPGLFRMIPSGLPFFPFAIWWLLHTLRVFTNRDYGILLIRHRGELVHRSVVSPRYFRFPFMGTSNLQICDTWTAEQHRGKGLAGFAIQAVLNTDAIQDRVYWYVCEESNISSIRVVEKLGFQKAGECIRVSRFGIRLLGSFVIEQPVPSLIHHPRSSP